MNVNFILPDAPRGGRKPTIFAASCLFALAFFGRLVAGYIGLGIEYILSLMPGGADPELVSTIAQAMYYFLFIALPVFLYYRAHPSSADGMRINPIAPSCALLSALAAIAGALFAIYVSYLWLILIETLGGTLASDGIILPDSAGGLIVMMLFSAVMPGICEELLFRGALLGAWEEKGSMRAMVISAVWFTLMHSTIEGIPTQMIVGMILAFVVVSTNSIFAGMIYHTAHNALCLIIAYVGAQTPVSQAEADMSAFELVGGYLGIASILMNIVVFGLLLFFILRRIDRRRLREGRLDFGYPPAKPAREADTYELIVICSGAVMAAMLYLVELFRMAGLIG